MDGGRSPSAGGAGAATEGGGAVAMHRLTLLGEFVNDGAKEAFDPTVYLACKQYMRKQESARLAAQQIFNEELLPSADFAIMTWNERIHLVLSQPFRTKAGRALVAIETTLVVITCASIIAETLPWYNPDIFTDQVTSWTIMDGCISNLFLLMLIVSIVVYPPPRRRVIFRWRTVIDLLTILPFYIQLVTDRSRRNILGMLKAFRILRFARLALHAPSFHIIALSMFKASKVLVAPMGLLVMICFTLASAVYFAERGSYDPVGQMFLTHDCVCESGADFVSGAKLCPLVESQHYSILHTMWLIVQATTTVGYGDLLPVCDVGKAFTVVAMLVGSLVLSIPIAVVGSYYSLLRFQQQERVRNLKAARTQSSMRSFSSIGSSSDLKESMSMLSLMIADAEAAGPSSVGAQLCRFLRENVRGTALHKPRSVAAVDEGGSMFRTKEPMFEGGSALSHCNLYYPTSELMYYLQVYLEDFAEELVLRGRNNPQPQETAQLVPTSSAASATAQLTQDRIVSMVGDGSVPLAAMKSRRGWTASLADAAEDAREAALTKVAKPITVGSVKACTTHTVQLFERLGDDNTSAQGRNRKHRYAQARAQQGLLSTGTTMDREAARDMIANSLTAQPSLFPGLYKGTVTAQVHLTLNRGFTIAPGDHVQIGEVEPAVSIAFAPQFGADYSTYLLEPWSAVTPHAVPRLLAASLGTDCDSGIDTVRGFRSSHGDYFVSERRLYPGNIVSIRGVAYQYRVDDTDMENAAMSFGCAVAEVLRRRSGTLSTKLHGMPVRADQLLRTLGHTTRGTGADGGRDRSPPDRRGTSPTDGDRSGQQLRRRTGSPQMVTDNAPHSSLPDRAAQLHAAHMRPDGELSMPFLSKVAVASSRGVAPNVELDRQRREKLKDFKRDLGAGGEDDGF